MITGMKNNKYCELLKCCYKICCVVGYCCQVLSGNAKICKKRRKCTGDAVLSKSP